MKLTFGILAHVDAGKTTFSEQILYHTGVIRSPGRVDRRSSFLDTYGLEKKRGITIFTGQAFFCNSGHVCYLIDTPGHADFSAEMERAISVMDYAILLVNGTDGIQGHTEIIWRLLEQYKVPVFLFVNKLDLPSASYTRVLSELQTCFSTGIMDFTFFSKSGPSQELMEAAAESDDGLLAAYLDNRLTPKECIDRLKILIHERLIFPCFGGSALSDHGIDTFLQSFLQLVFTDYPAEKECEGQELCGRIYKIRYEEQGERLTYLKLWKGCLHVKDTIPGCGKINQIRVCQGNRYETRASACAGDLIAVTGLRDVPAGQSIGGVKRSDRIPLTATALQARVIYSSQYGDRAVRDAFHVLEEEEPSLSVTWDETFRQLVVHIMGKIQLEILKELLADRFHIEVDFGRPEVTYRETISEPVVGYGHFEPLRHYAEVALRLVPGERGSGITFSSECHVDRLPANYQSLIRTHVFETAHKGILTGSDVTDIHVVLVDGRYHIKHTEGGDFREAVYRAIRQGLRKSRSLLLEPVYRFTLSVPDPCVGRVLADITKYSGAFQPPELSGGRALIKGTAPVASFMNYKEELAALTGGKGHLTVSFSHYEVCHNAEEVILQKSYDPDTDTAHPSASVFCQKGTSFSVAWSRAEEYMHCLKK